MTDNIRYNSVQDKCGGKKYVIYMSKTIKQLKLQYSNICILVYFLCENGTSNEMHQHVFIITSHQKILPEKCHRLWLWNNSLLVTLLFAIVHHRIKYLTSRLKRMS